MIRAALFEAVKHDLTPYIPRGCTKDDFGDATPTGVSALMLQHSLFKKWVPEDCISQDRAAFELFQRVNDASGKVEFSTWSSDDEMDMVLGEVKKELYNFFYPNGLPLLNNTAILERFDFGPGASFGSVGTDIISKMYGPIAGNEFCIALYKQKCSIHPQWQAAEAARCLKFGEPLVQNNSKLTFVPKTETISRTICIEPAINMLVQKGIGHIIEERLVEIFGVDFKGGEGLLSQAEVNRALARDGSLTGRFSTIDLSSASDTLSLYMYEKLLPRNVYAYLSLARSTSFVKDDCNGKFNMLSTMGNAFTFPMQTLLFTCLVKACYHVKSLAFRKTSTRIVPSAKGSRRTVIGNFGVFGDDIICLTDAADLVLRGLRYIGCEPNVEKTFTNGRFRESCGYDAYQGVNVRGVYIKSLRTREDIYIAYNQLRRWSETRGIPLAKTLAMLISSVNYQKRHYVPGWEADDAGFKTGLNEIWDDQPWFKPKPNELGAGVKRVVNNSTGALAFLYKKRVPRKSKIVWEEFDPSVRSPYGPVKPHYYVVRNEAESLAMEASFYLAFLRGNLRDGAVFVRDGETLYRDQTSISASW